MEQTITTQDEDIFSQAKTRFESRQQTELSIREFLEACKTDTTMYSTAAERMLQAIGEPTVIDTSTDPRMSRIFMNKRIKLYPSMQGFFGMEETIERLVAYFRHAAQGLEEKKQILYLLGPVGGGKSAMAEHLKMLFEKVPFYALKAGDQISPLYESPLGLFTREDWPTLEQKYNIDPRYLTGALSPWAAKRLREFGGDLEQFSVVKVWPSIRDQIGVTKTEPGDENNQDISALVGQVNIRDLEEFDQHDPDAYAYNGGLNLTTQGFLEFVEMFKAPIKMLHPLLTATQEGTYNGTTGFGAMPYRGVIMAHSNETEWSTFKNDTRNEAFLDRVYIVKVPYCLRTDEEAMIYKKLVGASSLKNAPCTPHVYDLLAQFSILTRMKKPENFSLFSKMRIYNGENLKDIDPKAKSIQESKDVAGVEEGMSGSSTRFAFKILSQAFNFDSTEIAANPVHVMYILEKQILQEQFPEEVEAEYLSFIKGILAPKYAEFLGDEIQKAYLESYSEYGQNLFDRYIQYADYWIQEQEYRDPDTGEVFDREQLNGELEKIEKPSGIGNPKDFRNEVVNFCLRAKANNDGKNPVWTSYNKLREVIEKKMFSNTEELLPVISFSKKSTAEEDRKHQDFVERMMKKGYTQKQVRILTEWYLRYKKHN